MKRTWMVSIVLIIMMTAISIQDDIKLNCQPKTTTETYPDTLFVFVVDLGGSPELLSGVGYIIKQLGCTIPIASTLKTYILDISDIDWGKNVDNDLQTSDKLVASVGSTFTTPKSARTAPCANYNQVTSRFSTELIITKHNNVKYLVLLRDGCTNPGIASKEIAIPLKLEPVGNLGIVPILLDERGSGIIHPEAISAPIFLKEASNKLIGEILGVTFQQPTEHAQQVSAKEGDTWTIIAFIISALVNVVFLAVICTLGFLLFKKSKRSDEEKVDKKDKKDKKKGKKGKKSKSLSKSGGQNNSGGPEPSGEDVPKEQKDKTIEGDGYTENNTTNTLGL